MRNITIVVLFVFLLSTAAAQEGKESYTAMAVGADMDSSRRTVQLEISIDRFTTDEELGDYLMLLREQGQEAARARLQEVRVGRVAPESEAGTHLSVARSFELNDQKVIRMLTTQPILSRFRKQQDSEYPFTILELRINPNGKGVGSVVGGARIQFKDGLLSFESSGNRYADLTGVRARD